MDSRLYVIMFLTKNNILPSDVTTLDFYSRTQPEPNFF